MKRRDWIRFKPRGSRARRERRSVYRQHPRPDVFVAEGPWRGWHQMGYMVADETAVFFEGPESELPEFFRELGFIDDQPPPTPLPAIPETEVGRRLKAFHREHPGLGRRGHSADFVILDEPWRYDT